MVAEFKGSVFRAYVTVLTERGLLDAFVRHASDALRERLIVLPTSSEWVAAGLVDEISDISNTLFGDEAQRELTFAAQGRGIVRIIEPLVRTALRLGGVSPHAVFSKLGFILAHQLRGFSWAYEPTGATRGRITMTVEAMKISRPAIVGWEAALEHAFSFVDASGKVRLERAQHAAAGSTVTFTASW